MEEEGRRERRKSTDALAGTGAHSLQKGRKGAHSHFLCSCSHPGGTKNSSKKMSLKTAVPQEKAEKKPPTCNLRFELQHVCS